MTGPGTHLKHMLRNMGFAVSDDETCEVCAERVRIMDEWGPAGCAENMEIILAWLKESAHSRGMVFFEPGARWMVRRCISLSEKELRQISKTKPA